MNNQLLLLINGWAGENHLLDQIMILCAQDLVYVVFLIALICIGYMIYEKEWGAIIYFFLTLVVSYGVLKLAALTNFDHRPFMDHRLTQLVAHASGTSFPSDHTTVATAVAIGVLFFMPFKKTGWLLLLAACVIGFARVFVGVHYPADIAAGLLAGFTGGGIVWLIKMKIEPAKQSITFPER